VFVVWANFYAQLISKNPWYVYEGMRTILIPSKRYFRALSCRCLGAGLGSSVIVGYCEERRKNTSGVGNFF